MMAGIMAIFEFGLSITGLEGKLLPPVDPYLEVDGRPKRIADRDFLQLISSPGLFGNTLLYSKELCSCLKCKVESDDSVSASCPSLIVENSPHCDSLGDQFSISSEYSFLKGYDEDFAVMDELSDFFATACVLKSSPSDHRVMIVPNDEDLSTPYGLYSCESSDCKIDN